MSAATPSMNGVCRQIVLVGGIACWLSLLGCDNQPGAPVGVSEMSPSARGAQVDLYSGDPAQIDSRFEQRLHEIAMEYNPEFSQMNGGIRWAPELCLAPPKSMSTSGVSTPHGRKLYNLFVKDADAYAEAAQHAQPVGQAIVKQSWIPVEVDEGNQETTWYVERDGKKYREGSQADLFIMFKEELDAAGTDEGWVYGTVTPDGKRVTSAGRVAACMECHRSAQPDRLFGAKNPIAAAED